jgi:chromate transporter
MRAKKEVELMLKMIFIFFKIGFLAFGGGWSIVGLMQEEMIKNGYLSFAQFTEAVSISQMTPGPVAVNMATYVGYRQYGIIGAILNTFFLVLPPVIILVFATFLGKFIKADKEKLFSSLGIATVILVSLTFLQMLLPNVTEYRIIIIAFMTFLLYIKTKIDPIYIILGAGFLGAFILG